MNFIVRVSVYIFGIFVMRCGWFATMPFMTIYIHNNASANPIVIGWIVGGGWLAACVCGLFGGIYVDKYSPRRIMLIALSISLLTFFTFYITKPTQLWLILGLNLLIGASSSIFEIASKTYVSSSFSDEQRVHAYSLRYTALNLGGVLGPFVGVWFTAHNPHQLFLFTAIMYLIVLILFFKALVANGSNQSSEAHKISDMLKTIISDKYLIALTGLSFMCYWAISQVETMLPQVLSTRIDNYTLVFASVIATNAITVVLLQIPFGFLVHRCSIIKLAYISSLLYSFSFVIFAFATSHWLLILAIIVFTLGEVIYATVVNLIVDKISNDSMRGIYFGVVSLGMLALFLAPIISGFILKKYGGTTLYLLTAMMLLGSIFCYRVLREKIAT